MVKKKTTPKTKKAIAIKIAIKPVKVKMPKGKMSKKMMPKTKMPW
jgi:hypothetical protein